MCNPALEPRRQRDDPVNIFVNLAATQEDHDTVRPPYFVPSFADFSQTAGEKDITMQAGKHKGVLPLIRKFNEHSERLLNAAE